MIGVDAVSQKALIFLYFYALLTYGRRRTSVNFGFVFANLCKHFTQKWSVLHFGTDHLSYSVFRIFAESLFFDYSDAEIDDLYRKRRAEAHRFLF